MFEPDAVERFDSRRKDIGGGDWVAAEDFDALLAMYREATTCPYCSGHGQYWGDEAATYSLQCQQCEGTGKR